MTRLHVPVHLRWGDMDAFNHVNNATLVKILEEARVRAFWVHEDPAQSAPTAVFAHDMRVGEDGPFLTLIAQQGIEYLAPIPYQQAPLDVWLWFTRFGGSSAEIAYEVWGGPGDETLFARATTVIVLASQASGRPVRMPAALREAWGPYLEEPVAAAAAR